MIAISYTAVLGLILVLAFTFLLVGFVMKIKALKIMALAFFGILLVSILLLGQVLGRM
jgi:hypothetical protein